MMIMPLREFDKMESSSKTANDQKRFGKLYWTEESMWLQQITHHTLEEKKQPILKAPSGGPLVQHAVVAMFESSSSGKISIEKIVEKCAIIRRFFKIEKRGFKEGYYADLVIVNSGLPWSVKKENIFAKCGWSPFEGFTFKSRITHTFVNGQLVYNAFKVKIYVRGKDSCLIVNRQNR
jgi:dihydroorotase